MLIAALAATLTGALAGGLVGAVCARRGRTLLIYMAVAALGTLLYVCLPMLRGHGYINGNPKTAAIVGFVFAGLAALFLPVRLGR